MASLADIAFPAMMSFIGATMLYIAYTEERYWRRYLVNAAAYLTVGIAEYVNHAWLSGFGFGVILSLFAYHVWDGSVAHREHIHRYVNEE